MTGPVRCALAAIAREEWTLRRERALAKVASGALRAGDANAFLKPWLAIACRLGVDLPELAEPLAEVRAIPGSRTNAAGTGRFFTEAEACVDVADVICPLSQIRETLAEAREDALDRAERQATAARVARARGLCALASHFGVAMQPRQSAPQAQVAA